MTSINSKRRRLFSVVRIHQCGTCESTWVEKIAFSTSMVAPINWGGCPAELHFWNYQKRVAINQQATDLFGREGVVFRGPVLIRTGDAMFYGLKIQGSKAQVERDLAGLGLNSNPVIIDSRDWVAHQNIYTQNQNDAFAIRLHLR
ncbi:hypothetical protein [Methylobacterium sp. P5_C11]